MIGWLGAICFMLCGAPQAWKCAQDGHARGLSWAFLWLWLGGETFTLIAIWPSDNLALKTNYVVSYVFLLIMLRYKVKERK